MLNKKNIKFLLENDKSVTKTEIILLDLVAELMNRFESVNTTEIFEMMKRDAPTNAIEIIDQLLIDRILTMLVPELIRITSIDYMASMKDKKLL